MRLATPWEHAYPLGPRQGTWTEIVTRICEPVLLGFAAVAARGRIQR
ncbi:MAG: hypothetical protein ACRDOH_13540 [Streptosporangiaceae bacterium]